MALWTRNSNDLETRLTDRLNKIKAELKVEEEIKEETEFIKGNVKSVKETQKTIKKTLLEQEIFIEKLHCENSASNVIINGILKKMKIDDIPTEIGAYHIFSQQHY